jgi:cyclopropane fatty-acyl-phospholipid synthase-like methyltransferase
MARDRDSFQAIYAGQAPWDIGKPQRVFIDVADRIGGALLDSGCGTGDTSLFFAERGVRVVGFDFLDEPIRRAQAKAADRGLAPTFLVKDALTLADWSEHFDHAIDSGLFHVFSDEDRRRYVAGLAHVLLPGGRLFLLCFSDEEPGTIGPRRITRQELEATFAADWEIESIQAAQLEVRSDLPPEYAFSEGGPKAWFTIVRRSQD